MSGATLVDEKNADTVDLRAPPALYKKRKGSRPCGACAGCQILQQEAENLDPLATLAPPTEDEIQAVNIPCHAQLAAWREPCWNQEMEKRASTAWPGKLHIGTYRSSGTSIVRDGPGYLRNSGWRPDYVQPFVEDPEPRRLRFSLRDRIRRDPLLHFAVLIIVVIGSILIIAGVVYEETEGTIKRLQDYQH
ncbi:hypothetical protein B0A48_10357 [Cryoendolithus antarcticus]|uniref:Uncharacterized protein n=1 Tax=Cryoendolithus antarcticus TaxID=1507870 RepID=A0A1V8SXQ4_9PEZI|nr:hypothetical protein B0A48_10357 [Cryoendolithus antarcticus]